MWKSLIDSVPTTSLRRAAAFGVFWLPTPLRPWWYRYWIFPRDPHFLERASPVLDLYACRWQNQPLWADEYVISADEKTSIQVRRRVQPTLPPGPHQAIRVEHEYQRGGAI